MGFSSSVSYWEKHRILLNWLGTTVEIAYVCENSLKIKLPDLSPAIFLRVGASVPRHMGQSRTVGSSEKG